ncbi:amino acid ABC transporter permease [Aestuariimicrobium soli]|uniref:amino acid ABC transporter permease n=1 Tax=Aestuariimicrobium soli TaxID=2035834 RepID=UPI003EB6B889
MSSQATVVFDAPGPRGRALSRVVGLVGALLCLAVAAVLIWALRKQLLVADKWRPFTEVSAWRDYVLPGLWQTIKAAGLSVITAGVVGVLLGVGRLSHVKVISLVSGVLVEFFRSVPVLVMMFFFYFLFLQSGALSGDALPFASVVLGLTFYNGSVIAELIRSGVHSLPKGQREAGWAIGLTRDQTLWSVLLPQAITAMLPSLLSQLVVVLKDTALGYIVTYPDLLRSLTTFASNNSNILASLIVAAVIYIAINYALTSLAGWVETKVRTRRAGRAVAAGAVPVPAAGTAGPGSTH